MNLTRFLLAYFLLLWNVAYSEEDKSPSIRKVFLTSDEVQSHFSEEVRAASRVEIGFPKTFLYFSGFPKEKTMIVSKKRPLTRAIYQKTSELTISQNGLILDAPYYLISARGFLPGERVSFKFETEDGQFQHEISLTPNPIIVKDKDDNKLLMAELISLLPANYKIKLYGIKGSEKMILKSISGTEKLEYPIEVKTINGIAYSPDTIRGKGGIGKLCFIRQSGQKIAVELPWGTKLLDYLDGLLVYEPGEIDE